MLRPAHPLPTLPLETALAPTDGSCGSLRNRAQSTADIFLPVRLVGEEGQGRGVGKKHSNTPRPAPRVESPAPLASQLSPVTRSFSPTRHPEPVPPFPARQTDHLWLANPSYPLGAAVFPIPLPTPRVLRMGSRPAHPPTQMSHPRLQADLCRSGRSLAPGSRYFGQTPRPPCSSARAPELQGRGSPRGSGALLPAVHCCHALPNLSATSRFPDISELRSPQQQFGAVRASHG